jgi:hypothetical protein
LAPSCAAIGSTLRSVWGQPHPGDSLGARKAASERKLSFQIMPRYANSGARSILLPGRRFPSRPPGARIKAVRATGRYAQGRKQLDHVKTHASRISARHEVGRIRFGLAMELTGVVPCRPESDGPALPSGRCASRTAVLAQRRSDGFCGQSGPRGCSPAHLPRVSLRHCYVRVQAREVGKVTPFIASYWGERAFDKALLILSAGLNVNPPPSLRAGDAFQGAALNNIGNASPYVLGCSPRGLLSGRRALSAHAAGSDAATASGGVIEMWFRVGMTRALLPNPLPSLRICSPDCAKCTA